MLVDKLRFNAQKKNQSEIQRKYKRLIKYVIKNIYE